MERFGHGAFLVENSHPGDRDFVPSDVDLESTTRRDRVEAGAHHFVVATELDIRLERQVATPKTELTASVVNAVFGTIGETAFLWSAKPLVLEVTDFPLLTAKPFALLVITRTVIV